MTRTFHAPASARPNPEAVERTVIHQTAEAALVVWHLLPGQEIPPHRHPAGQDTWVVLSGEAEYLMEGGRTLILRAGDIAVAERGQIHGARNLLEAPFIFTSVVSPADAGYQLETAD